MSQAVPVVRSNVRLAIWLAVVLTLSALAFLGRFLSEGETDRNVIYEWDAFVGGVVQFGIMLAIVLWISSNLPRRELLALRRPRSWPSAIGLALLVLVATFVVAGLLRPLGDAGEEQGLLPEGWDSSRAAPFAANAALVTLMAPIVEELMFRGLGFALLIRFGPAVAIGVSGALFGAVHGVLIGLPLLAFFGAGLAYLRYRTASLYPGILLHAFFNGMALIASVTLGSQG